MEILQDPREAKGQDSSGLKHAGQGLCKLGQLWEAATAPGLLEAKGRAGVWGMEMLGGSFHGPGAWTSKGKWEAGRGRAGTMLMRTT